jgi:hypothetical protein
MAALTITTIIAPFATVAANAADVTMTAGDTGGDTIACNGRDVIIAQNTHAADPYTITIASEIDEQNRTGDITTYSLAAGEIAVFGVGLTNSVGWKDATTGLISVDVENAAVKWGILRLPAGYPG